MDMYIYIYIYIYIGCCWPFLLCAVIGTERRNHVTPLLLNIQLVAGGPSSGDPATVTLGGPSVCLSTYGLV